MLASEMRWWHGEAAALFLVGGDEASASMMNRGEGEQRGTHRLSGEERESISSGRAPPIRASHTRDVC
jgi:hypothetical protein